MIDACRFYVAHLEKQNGSATVAEFCHAVRKEFDRRLDHTEIGERHHETMVHTLKQVERVFGDQKVKTITGEQIKSWLSTLPLATKSKNRHFGYAKTAFATGKELGLVNVNPLENVTSFHVNKKLVAPPRPLAPAEAVKLINSASEDVKPWILIGLFSGVRSEERNQLRWESVSDTSIDLSAKVSKTGKRRIVPVEPNLLGWLKSYRKESGLIALTGKEGQYSRKRMQEAFTKAIHSSGIDWQANSLRDSYASYHFEKYGSAASTAKNCGHSERMMGERYAQVVTAENAKKFWSILPGPKGEAKISV